MSSYFYVACDGGMLNTLAGGGGILEIRLEPTYGARYFEFPHGTGGSTHMVLPTPDKRALVATSANVGRVAIIPLGRDGADFDHYRVLNEFNSLGVPQIGWDNQTAMFDFLDNEHIVVHYNRKLIKVGLETGSMEVIVDLTNAEKAKPGVIHQIDVTDEYIIANDGALFVYDRQAEDLFVMGDGMLGGHHLVYDDDAGDTIVIRPSFNIQSVDGHLKIDDNTLSFYNLEKRRVKTFYYGWDEPNHQPTEMVKEGDYLFVNYAVPGSVCKINLKNGFVEARYSARPSVLTRWLSTAMDGIYFALDHGTLKNRYDTTLASIYQILTSIKIALLGGTRAGFFAMGSDPEQSDLYVCHRGLNRVYCLDKKHLRVQWSRRLPSRKLDSEMVGWFYRHFPYFRRCLGAHHGTLVSWDAS